MDTLANFVDRRAFQMKTEYAGNLQRALRNRSKPLDHIGAIGDQRRQTTCSPRPAVGFDNAAHAGLARVIVKENAATAIDLDIDEAGRENRVGGKRDHARRLASRQAPGHRAAGRVDGVEVLIAARHVDGAAVGGHRHPLRSGRERDGGCHHVAGSVENRAPDRTR